MEKTTTSYEGKGANSFFLFKRNLLTLTQFSEQTLSMQLMRFFAWVVSIRLCKLQLK